MKSLDKAMYKFNLEKQQAKESGKKYSVSYGKWNDSWNLNNVLLDALKYHLIEKILNN